jgi:hypothetical protein
MDQQRPLPQAGKCSPGHRAHVEHVGRAAVGALVVGSRGKHLDRADPSPIGIKPAAAGRLRLVRVERALGRDPERRRGLGGIVGLDVDGHDLGQAGDDPLGFGGVFHQDHLQADVTNQCPQIGASRRIRVQPLPDGEPVGGEVLAQVVVDLTAHHLEMSAAPAKGAACGRQALDRARHGVGLSE